MANRIAEAFPEPKVLLQLGTEEIGLLILEFLKTLPNERRSLSRLSTFVRFDEMRGYAGQQYPDVARAIAEAWSWLEHERLIAPDAADINEGYTFVTKRGLALKSKADLETYRQARLLVPDTLHPVLSERVVPLYLRGDYDTAVFQAFKEVEVRVRSAGGLEASRIGKDLMRKAFDVQGGPLTDTSLLEAERQAMSDLFAGAIGLLKNPPSHRAVVLTPIDAARQIQIADYLLRIVEGRVNQRGP